MLFHRIPVKRLTINLLDEKYIMISAEYLIGSDFKHSISFDNVGLCDIKVFYENCLYSKTAFPVIEFKFNTVYNCTVLYFIVLYFSNCIQYCIAL